MTAWKQWLLCAALAGAGCSDESESPRDGSAEPVGAGPSDAGASTSLDGGRDGGRRDASIVVEADAGSGGNGDPIACSTLNARIRDFKGVSRQPPLSDEHPDFETYEGTVPTPGLVEPMLGADSKPVLNPSRTPNQITSEASFAQWYNDAEGVNVAIEIPIELRETATGSYEFDSAAFFPIDGMGFGEFVSIRDGGTRDSGHNFHFTTEIHTQFTYRGGEKFEFRGDDDLWIFVNGRLALDFGGLHPPYGDGHPIDFDALASMLGIEPGQTYRMDIFHAERHTVQSNFRIRTNIDCFQDVPAI